jgi:hypothetical protein
VPELFLPFVPARVPFVTGFGRFVNGRGVSSQFLWGGARRRGILHVAGEGRGGEKLEPRREDF